ncbi:MAG: hypothetical protein ACLPN6_25940 [Streptosporangiaceae bacterium]
MAWIFCTLKFRLMTGALRGNGSAARGAGLILAGLAALYVMPTGFAVLAALRGSALAAPAGVLVFTLAFAGWTVLPLMAFGTDETLDPARLTLLPLSRRQLATGMFAAALTGIGPIVTFVILLGVIAAVATSPASVAIGVLAVLLELTLCVTSSRALTTALSGLLRSRRGRDLGIAAAGALVLVLLGGNVLIQRAIISGGLQHGGRAIAGVARWTPPGMVAQSIASAASGRYAAALLGLGVGAATALLLLWVWNAALGRALTSPDASTRTSRRSAACASRAANSAAAPSAVGSAPAAPALPAAGSAATPPAPSAAGSAPTPPALPAAAGSAPTPPAAAGRFSASSVDAPSLSLYQQQMRFDVAAARGAAAESAGGRPSGPPGRPAGRPGRVRRAAVAPGWLRQAGSSRTMTAAGKELRYTWRDPRRKAGLLGLAIAVFVSLSVTRLGTGGSRGLSSATGPVLLAAAVYGGAFAGIQSANQFGLDGGALWLNVAATTRPRDLRADIAGKNLASAVIALPVFTVLYAVIGAVWGSLAYPVTALGVAAATLGIALGLSNLASVLLPFPVPERRASAFGGGGTGRGCLAGLTNLVMLLIVAIAMLPLIALIIVVHPGAWMLLTGPGYGAAAAWAGRRAAGDIGFRRLPELLAAVSRPV